MLVKFAHVSYITHFNAFFVIKKTSLLCARTHTLTLKLSIEFVLKSSKLKRVGENKFSELAFYMFFALFVCLVQQSIQYNAVVVQQDL